MNSSSNEMRLIIPKGCDNAPRKKIVIDFTVALLKQQHDVINEYADEHVVWFALKDHKKFEGRSSLSSILHDEDKNIVDCLEIDQVLTHGKFASINGVISLANGSKIDFCDVYMFSHAGKSGKVVNIGLKIPK
ncbi:hypothetical protein G4V62_17595, partial [Bacillaceae bacterium SIJ1]|uniref:hypothetical protein n=1 Tax=Litoribacterium kuwaitense TaxID=1398745 RepID=UPI0013EAAD65